MNGWRVDEHHFESWDGARLFYRAWHPGRLQDKAVILFHGGHEHSGRFTPVIEALDFRRREANDISWVLPFRTVVILICLYAASYLLFGAAFYLIILSLTPFPIVHIPLAVGAYTLAMVIGRMVFFLPAGLGVREGVLVAILSATMPLEVAVIVSLTARIWATAVDLIVVGACFVYDSLSGERILMGALWGRKNPGAGPVPADDLPETITSQSLQRLL